MTAFQKFREDFSGKRVLVFGLGRLGRGAEVVRTFASIGCQVTVTDQKTKEELAASMATLKDLPITYRLGGHRHEDILAKDIVIRNPGVPWDHPLLRLARRRRILVSMDSALFARYFQGTIVGVTGTRGKTTTTMMIQRIISHGLDKRVLLVGNATRRANLSMLKSTGKDTVAVGELSSWELQGWRHERRSPHIAVVTNIYPDHLDRYGTLEEYVQDKESIFLFQKDSDWLIVNRDNDYTRSMADKARSHVLRFSAADLPQEWKLRIPGDHNREDAAAARRVGEVFGISREAIQTSLESFSGVRHRLEMLGTIGGVSYICDTTATTPIATIKALETISDPPILLVGGNSKYLPIEPLVDAIRNKTRAVILLKGNGSLALEQALRRDPQVKIIFTNRPFDESVKRAISLARPGDTVLLSPAFTSFAEFSNEFERGERFHKLVRLHALKRRSTSGVS